MKKTYANGSLIITLLIIATTLSALTYSYQDDKSNAGLIMPQGFKAIKLIEGIGKDGGKFL